MFVDRRPLTIAGTLALIVGFGLMLRYWPQAPGAPLPEPVRIAPPPAAASEGKSVQMPMSEPVPPPAVSDPAGAPAPTPLARHFQAAVEALQSGRYQQALGALHQVLRLAPRLPEAHVNMGFALLGLGRGQAAANFFAAAIELRPGQVNAYYGLALAQEALNDLPAALGAMRSYIHLTSADDPRLPKARAALWEWDSQLNHADAETAAAASAAAPEGN